MSRRTVARPAELAGVGLHTGVESRLRIRPALPGSGIVFRLEGDGRNQAIPALLGSVADTERRTALQSGGARVDTVEHLLAAVSALGLDDLLIEIAGPEVPILDGSFAPFVALLAEAGVRESRGRRRTLTLPAPVAFEEGGASYRAEPHGALTVEVTLEYAEPVIGRQTARVTLGGGRFEEEIAPARTFGFLAEVGPLRARGLLGGASAGCAIVLAEDRVLNTELRWPDEFARHKVGDLIGDLALLGARLHTRVSAVRPSHRGNIAFARRLAGAVRFTEE